MFKLKVLSRFFQTSGTTMKGIKKLTAIIMLISLILSQMGGLSMFAAQNPVFDGPPAIDIFNVRNQAAGGDYGDHATLATGQSARFRGGS